MSCRPTPASLMGRVLPLALLLACSCNLGLLAPPVASRTLTIRVVADSDFADHVSWRKNVENLIDNAGIYYKSWFGIDLQIDTFLVWDIEKSPSYGKMLDHDCLVNDVPKEASDIVIYFSKEADRDKLHYLELSHFSMGYLWVVQADVVDIKAGYIKAFHTLLHELGHLFGAMHLYDDGRQETRHMMTPYVTDNVIEKKGKVYTYMEPTIHPGNAKIIATVSRYYPFSRKLQPDSLEPVLASYRSVRAQHCPWRLSDEGRLQNYQFNAFHEEDWFSYAATWAALFGRDSLAKLYCDSLSQIITAIRATCDAEDGACKARFCRRAGCHGTTLSLWEQKRRIGALWTESMIHLRTGHDQQADSVFNELLAVIPKEFIPYRGQLRGSFAFYRNYFAEPREQNPPMGH